MYRLFGEDFHFVATFMRDSSQLKGGLDYSSRPYCVLAAENNELADEAHRLNIESDVCVFGAGNLNWEKERATTDKLSFEVSERWLKKGWRNVFSPRLIQWWLLYQRQLKNKPFYRLCCSAFTVADDVKLGCYKGRHYKWGYFTEVKKNLIHSDDYLPLRLMWCARFLKLKHPELPILMAARLKEEGYKFVLDYYGDQDKAAKSKDAYARADLQKLIHVNNLENVVILHGNLPNSEVLEAMRQHDIFLFTSNRLEGWGAVVNEAMANECCVVASDVIGSVPYLISEGETGLTFRSGRLDSLYAKVKYLFDNPDDCKRMAKAARQSMVEVWNPANAALSLLKLIEELQQGQKVSIQRGPCSIAE